MRKFVVVLFLFNLLVLPRCTTKVIPGNTKKSHKINLIHKLYEIENISNPEKQIMEANKLWDSLILVTTLPYIKNDTVIFLYKTSSDTVHLAGDMTAWRLPDSYRFNKIGSSDLHYQVKTFPSDARLDYKVVIDKKEWNTDPQNPNYQVSGFGKNSFFAMPKYVPSRFVEPVSSKKNGNISETLFIKSKTLDNQVRYWVYLPPGYDKLINLPAVYVLDGHEYKTPKIGSMKEVLDNLILEKRIKPVMVIFVDPINPVTNQNQRADLYLNNEKYAEFFKTELIPTIDSIYRTKPNAENRLIMGTSYGGNCAAYFGYFMPEVFGLIGMQSPSFNSDVQELYLLSDNLNLKKVFISTGVIYDTEVYADKIEKELKRLSIPYKYLKVNEGHSWGNWSALLDDLLIYFFEETKNTDQK